MPSPTSRLPPEHRDRPLPVNAILIMLAKGMTPREITTVFPELALEDVRSALLHVAELMKDPEASLAAELSVEMIIENARCNTDLSDDEAMELAVEVTREVRRERTAARRTR